MEQTDLLNQEEFQQKSVEYASFWWRTLALLIDGVLLYFVNMMISVPFSMQGFLSVNPEDPSEIISLMLMYSLLSLVIYWLYDALLESSKFQATFGKMAIKLFVTDEQGKKISFARATGRHFGKYLSMMILFIGFVMVAFTPKKQGLHDILAGTLVNKGEI